MSRFKMPEIDWQSSVCPVCGEKYDWIKVKPRTCNKRECLHKYIHRIDCDTWAYPPAAVRGIAKRQAANRD